MSSDLLNKGYEPHDVEKRWYDFWEKELLFAANEEKTDQKCYSIVIPPPNVTGVLHMGHALNNTLQDILCRYRRLRGDNVLWMPGTDHAGIATQNVVEKKLADEGMDRHRVGRKKFIEAVWEWRSEYGNAIINQLKRLGASCDWDRERFTMDEGLSRAVRKVFVSLYQEGLIYRGNYIINWCHRCHTALADLEVEHEAHEGHLYYVRYPFTGGPGGVVIATTRPETMLGDTAVAVNPDDERYQGMKSLQVILPLMDRTIPIIKDNLERIKVIGDDGRMTSEAGKFKGLDRFECRKAVVNALKELGLLEKIESYQHSIGHCYRCKTIIEPNLSKQWFIRTKPLAKKAIDAVKKGDTKIIPEVWTKTYFDWMNNIKDWCISRQIWWGHQIPAWTCTACEKITVALDTPARCPACGGADLVQDTDVLDTWFSSALWPFSTMGWPDQTPLLKLFYPTSVLVTGFDILFFWVARMMMMGIHFMEDVPFKNVYVHALVRDEAGKKMSKSTGNVIDPLSIIDRYGTDAFRFTLAAFAAQGRDVKMSEKRVEGYRNFINKIWNAARFSLTHINKSYTNLIPQPLSLVDRWILSRLYRVSGKVSEALDSYRFNDAAGMIYTFVWHEFCDWYLEAIKPTLFGKEGQNPQQATLGVLWRVLHDTLILLHPFIPFITEEIWHKLPGTQGSIMKAAFPLYDDTDTCIRRDEEAESHMRLVSGIITGIRNIRGEMNISPSLSLAVSAQSQDESTKKTIQQHRDMIINLARLNSLSVGNTAERPKSAATVVVNDATIFVSLEGIVDFAKEIERLEKEINKLRNESTAVLKKLNNEDFLKKAPPDVVEKVKAKHNLLVEKQQKLLSNLTKIKELEA